MLVSPGMLAAETCTGVCCKEISNALWRVDGADADSAAATHHEQAHKGTFA
jgi:hypothetical protein